MNIREAEKKDLSTILSINQSALPHVNSIELSELEEFLKVANPFIVIEMDGTIAGFIIVLQKGLDYDSLNYKFFCNNYYDFDYVDRIVISEHFRGKKLGTALYKYLFNHSDKKQITCEINIKPPNVNSMKFHKSLGFKQVAKLVTEKGAKGVAMMVKEL
ncbi:GNAT family N-acetyltransferase [Gracilimonas sp.]|uniref:GNAT family N-acetyltransferase n=1 Tax=Gracilimonas sp. TaxID=1974203 RepID=UPI00287166B6|nr:GNAT family N-acetyltransferase [Gracilimonas sp.]